MISLQLQLLLIILGQVAFIAILIFRGSEIKSKVFLIVLLETLFLQMLMKLIDKIWLMETFKRYYYMGYDVPFLFGPLLYMYSKSKTQTPKSKVDLILFIPFGLSAIVSLLRESIQHAVKEKYYLIIFSILGGLQLLLLTYCSIKSWQCFSYAQSNLRNVYSHAEKIFFTWSYRFVWAVFLSAAFLILYLRIAYLFAPFSYLPFFYIPFLVALLGITYYSMFEPELNQEDAEVIDTLKPKYANSKIDDRQAEILSLCLQNVMTQERLFLDPELSIDKLADALSTTKHKVSQLLNSYLHTTYFDYVNKWRIEEAKKLLVDAKMRQYTLLAIAVNSGFNSYTTFNLVFKKLENMTPQQYKKLYTLKVQSRDSA